MTAQEVNFSNFYESTLASLMASSATDGTLTAAPTSNGTSNISVPYYLVVDPDEQSKREVILVTAASGTSMTTIERDKENRHGGSPPDHQADTVVRMAVVKEMFEDLHDRVDAAPTATSSTVFTNKSIDSDTNTITNIVNADIKSSAAIAQSKLNLSITNSEVNASAAIDASKIHNGNVSNTEFGYLDGVSSAIQTQLDSITAGTSTLTVPITVKVADDGSGSQNVFYFLNGSDTGAGTRSSNFVFKVGFKYKFDTSDSSLSGHNFKFSIKKDGENASGSEFTTNVTTAGTPGSAGASTTIEITPETLGIAGATSVLYYYCSNHSGMGGNGKISLDAGSAFKLNGAKQFFALNG
jgi:hypothetical protein